MNIKIKVLLFLILALAAFLRFWQVVDYPAGINADEAAYAYNAFSLAQTGMDEQGVSWPVHLVSFADYKPGGTAYILLPLTWAFGMGEGVLRFPSALAGVLSVLALFFLTRKLFGNDYLALTSAFFLSISPWHIHFSRGAWETNIATTAMLFGVWFFFKGLEKQKYLLWSVFAFAVSMYTYHSPRVVIPILGLFLLIFYRKKLLGSVDNIKWVFVSAFLGLVLLTPLMLDFTGPAGSARFSGVSVFSDIGPFWEVNRARGEHGSINSVQAKIFHNKPVAYGLRLAQNYLNHFDGVFLFVLGDPIKRSSPPNMGQMYLIDFFFLAAGFYFLFRKKPDNWQVPLVWLAVAPLAASVTFQTPNALRAHNMVIPLVLIASYGFYNLLVAIKGVLAGRKLYLVYFILLTAIFWNATYFLHQYFVHYPKTYPEAWEYGFRELVPYLESVKGDYQTVYVTERYDQPYIIFLFYLQYPPEKFQKEAVLTKRDKFGFSTVRDFDKFHFENIIWDDLKGKPNILICGTDKEIPDKADIVKTVNFRNDKPAFQCAKT